MDKLIESISSFAGWLWAFPLLILLVICGVLFTVRLEFFQFRHALYIIKQTFGKIFSKGAGEGTVSPFQAAATALACTVGAANIVGVPIAIAFGGPGAVFWMWVCACLGMATKFSEIVLGMKYREKNEDGVFVSGPMYYMSKGIPIKKVGKVMALVWTFIFMCFMPFSIAAQSTSAAQNGEFLGLPPMVTGVLLTVIIGVITFGGIKRIAKITDKMVPIMVLIYITGALIVIGSNIEALPQVVSLIFKSAFNGHAALGGFAGAGIAAAIRWGFARGTYSTDVGMGSAPMGHASATTDHPVRQGFWGIFEVAVSGLIICSMSAFTVLTSGAWTTVSKDVATTMPAVAFQGTFGPQIGGVIVAICLLIFVLSTMIVQVYYGEKQCEFLFGTKAAKVGRLVFVLSIMMGVLLNLETIFILLDLALGLVLLPHIFSLLWMNGQVVELKKEFFSDERYYKKDIKKEA